MKEVTFSLCVEPSIPDKLKTIGRFQRILGNLIDYIAIAIIFCGVNIFINPDFAYTFPGRLGQIVGYPLCMWSDKISDGFVGGMLLIILVSLYYLICEITLRASLGKWICGGILLEKNGEKIEGDSILWRRVFQTVLVIIAYVVLFNCVSYLGGGGILFLIFLRLLCNGAFILISKESLYELLDDYHYYKRKDWKQLFPEYAVIKKNGREKPDQSLAFEEKAEEGSGAQLNTSQNSEVSIDIPYKTKEVSPREVPNKSCPEQEKKKLSRRERILTKYLLLCLLVGLIWLAIQLYGGYTGILNMDSSTDNTWQKTVTQLLCTNICAIILLLVLHFRKKHPTNYDFILPSPLSNYFNKKTCSDTENRSIMLSLILPLYVIAPIPSIGYYALLYLAALSVLIIIIFGVRDVLSWIYGRKKKWKNVILVSYTILFFFVLLLGSSLCFEHIDEREYVEWGYDTYKYKYIEAHWIFRPSRILDIMAGNGREGVGIYEYLKDGK